LPAQLDDAPLFEKLGAEGIKLYPLSQMDLNQAEQRLFDYFPVPGVNVCQPYNFFLTASAAS